MYNKDVELLAEAYSVIMEGTHKCPKCNKSMGKHTDEAKAKKGYKYCTACDVTYSPEGSKSKGSWADEEAKRKEKQD